MSYIQGFNRKQAVLIPKTIEQLIAENNPVQFIDAFVNSLAVVDFGFKEPIIEHPFGTMKRQWGFDHIMTKKSVKHATAEIGFYNLKRIVNIIGIDQTYHPILAENTYSKSPIILDKSLEQIKKSTVYFIENGILKSKTKEIAYF